MTQTLTVNPARPNLYTSLVAGVQQLYTPKQFPKLVFGETVGVDLFLANDARSGAAGSTPRIAITLDDVTPKAGTFTLSDGVENFIVSGAGATETNGTYRLIAEQFNSHPVWQFIDGATSYFIRRETHGANNTWHLVQADNAAQVPANKYFYSDGQNGGGPQLTGWIVDDDGIAPAPTLASYVETTAALEWDATETEIKAALNKLNLNTGPFGSTVKVAKYANGSFNVFFDTAGNRVALAVNASGIQPVSSASILPVVEGDATTSEQQLIQIKAEPLVFSDGGVAITDGWSMTLNANNANFLKATALEAISANYSIEIVSADLSVDVIARGPVILEPSYLSNGAITPFPPGGGNSLYFRP